MGEETKIYEGDSLEILASLSANSIEALCTDPPAGISFMGKAWDSDKGGRDEWIKWLASVMRECYRVMKPGAHGLVWALPRTAHWTATACEDAGFQIRDVVHHVFGSGFPKSLNVGNGFGTALKPAVENWILIRKHVEGTVAANVLKWGTGALNIDGARIESGERPHIQRRNDKALDGEIYGSGINGSKSLGTFSKGRFPANVIFDEAAGEMLDAQSGELKNGGKANNKERVGLFGKRIDGNQNAYVGDTGGASRFFYCAKASKRDKGEENNHPTVKNTALMRYLIRLVTPPKGTVLDPFMGSGSTGVAAKREGFSFIGIEREKTYADIAERRIEHG